MASYIWVAEKTRWGEVVLRLRFQPSIGPIGMSLAHWRAWREVDLLNKSTGKFIPDYLPQRKDKRNDQG